MLSLILSLSLTASALDCYDGLLNKAPGDNRFSAEHVPSNLTGYLWFSFSPSSDASTWTLEHVDSGELLPVTISSIRNNGSDLLTWTTDQALSGEYRLVIPIYDDFVEEFSFIVSGEADNTSPAAPQIVSTDRVTVTDEWDASDYLKVYLTDLEEPIIVKLEAGIDSEFSEKKTIYRALSAGADRRVSLGNGPCETSASSAFLDSVTHIRLTAIDLAGNESEAFSLELEMPAAESDAEEASTNEESKVGCSSIGVGSASSLFLCGIIGLVGTRRNFYI